MTERKIYPFDIAILGYVSMLSILVLIFGRPLGHYVDELLMNLIVVALVVAVIYFLHDEKRKLILFFRILYPAALFTLFYEQTGGLMQLFFPGFLDSQLIAFEKSILGVNPTFWIEQNILNVWLTEILSATYASYYFMILMFVIFMFFKGEYRVIKKALTAICITFFISYMLFYLYPIEGPRYFFAGQYAHDISGPVFRPIVEMFQEASVRGGCMPSSHIAVALIINIFCLIHYRRIGIVLIPINIGMALGTFYGRYHYVSDVIVGLAIGAVVAWLTLKYYDRFDKKVAEGGQPTKLKESYVS